MLDCITISIPIYHEALQAFSKRKKQVAENMYIVACSNISNNCIICLLDCIAISIPIYHEADW